MFGLLFMIVASLNINSNEIEMEMDSDFVFFALLCLHDSKIDLMEIEIESISYSNQTDQIHLKIDQIDCKKKKS